MLSCLCGPGEASAKTLPAPGVVFLQDFPSSCLLFDNRPHSFSSPGQAAVEDLSRPWLLFTSARLARSCAALASAAAAGPVCGVRTAAVALSCPFTCYAGYAQQHIGAAYH